MKCIRGLCILLLTITCSGVFACGPDFLVKSAAKADGTKVGLLVHGSDFDGIPVWKLGDPWLPEAIDAYKAQELALDWAQDKYSRYDRVDITAPAMVSVGLEECGYGAMWIYVFEAQLEIDGNALTGVGNWVGVLLDGTVVAPTELGL